MMAGCFDNDVSDDDGCSTKSNPHRPRDKSEDKPEDCSPDRFECVNDGCLNGMKVTLIRIEENKGQKRPEEP